MKLLSIFIVLAISSYTSATATVEELVLLELEKNPTVTENAEGDAFSIEYEDSITRKTNRLTLYKSVKNFNEARKYCFSENSHLAIGRTLDDLVKFVTLLRLKNVEAAWIGIHDLHEDWDWVSLLDEPLDDLELAQFWKPGEPNHSQSNEHCVELWANGMNDNNCAVSQAFFCLSSD